MGKATTTPHGQHIMFYIIRSQLVVLRHSTAIVSQQGCNIVCEQMLTFGQFDGVVVLVCRYAIHDVHINRKCLCTHKHIILMCIQEARLPVSILWRFAVQTHLMSVWWLCF